MVEQGTVVEVKGKKAIVELEQRAHCGRCSAFLCVGCPDTRIEVDTVPDVRIGDHVEVEVPISRLKAVFTVFLLPLAAVLLGAWLGNYLTERWFPDTSYPDLLAIGLAVVLVAATFAGVYTHERGTGKRRKRPYIRRTN